MKKKIFIAVQNIIDQGGISKSIQNLLNEIHEQYEVTICAVCNYISPNVSLPDDVKIIPGSQMIGDAILNRNLLKNTFGGQIRMIVTRWLRRKKGMSFIVNKGRNRIKVPNDYYDVAIAFSGDRFDKNGVICDGGDYEFILQNVKAKRKIAWIHNDLRKEGLTHDVGLRVFEDFDAIVSVSYENKSLVDAILPEYKNKSFVIYNTYNIQQIIDSAKAEGNPFSDNGKLHFVTVARLSMAQKRQDRIIKACERLKKEGLVNFDWCLVGDGEKEYFENMIAERGVGDLVKLVGLKTNPYPYYLHADAFVLTSLYEGYGMTVKEAQILGCPTLITNFGPAHEAVKDGYEGRICDNSTDGVYEIMKHILKHPDELETYRSYLREHPVNNAIALQQFKDVCGL